MKKLLFIALMLTMTLSAQDTETSITGELQETADGLMELAKLADITTIKELFIHYTQEAVEGSKGAIKSGVSIVEEAVGMLLEEGGIIVRQFLIFTSISYGLLLLLGVILIFYIPKRIAPYFRMSGFKAAEHNNKQKSLKDDFKREPLYPYYMESYYKNKFSLVSSTILSVATRIAGAAVIIMNITPFIKVTFFSKLYLVEMLIKYI